MLFHWSLSESKCPQVSRTLLSILADLDNTVVWTVSTRPAMSKSSSYCINPLVTVPSSSSCRAASADILDPLSPFLPIIHRHRQVFGIIVNFLFHNFFNSLARSRYLSIFLLSLNFILWSAGTAKSIILQVLVFCWLFLCLVVWPRVSDLFVCENSKGVCASHSPEQILDCAYNICS